MTIAIHITRSLHLYERPFNLSPALELAAMMPENHFVFICDKDILLPEDLPANCSVIRMITSSGSRPALWFINRINLPRLLKKVKADLFITAGDICCFHCPIPQYVIFHDRAAQKKHLRSYLQRRKRSITLKATKIFAADNLDMITAGHRSLIQLHPALQDRWFADNEGLPDQHESEVPDGYAYFLFTSSAENEEEYKKALKAFSVFKKWQKSSMHLVILATGEHFAGLPSLSTYLYREDVKVIRAAQKKNYRQLLAKAYAVISFSGLMAANSGYSSLRSGVPFITTGREGNRRFFGDHCLFASDDHSDLGQKMILIYKDESLREELTGKGRIWATRFSARSCAREIAAAISGHN
jgi:glycosyltransferase involved in cell wall biosynthesis